jgi:hypothetical protein
VHLAHDAAGLGADRHGGLVDHPLDQRQRGTFGTGRPAGRGEGRPPRPRE